MVERSRELPPLSNSLLPDFAAQIAARVAPGAVQTDAATATAVTSAPAAPHPAAPAIQSGSAVTTATDTPLWQDQVKQLKDAQELDAALSLCQQQFPKSQAFQQAAIVLRLQMKQQLEQQEDIAPLLGKLYRCAVLADLFRNGIAPRPQNARTALKQLAAHEFDYQLIGHNQLKLLSKSDVRLLEQRWGVPGNHCHAETALGSLWENICR